jgi:hypothetical protein
MSQGEILFLNSRQYLANNHGERVHHYKLERIVMQGITGVNEKTRLKMTLIGDGTFCANSVNYTVLSDSTFQREYLLGLLNSTLLNFVCSKTSTNSNVNGYEVDNLPIRLSDSSGQAKLAGIVRQILTKKQRDPEADTTTLEKEVDRFVYDMYGLTSSDIKLVGDRSVAGNPIPESDAGTVS